VREVDQSFANVYSTAVSVQNLLPRPTGGLLTVLIGALITVARAGADINSYSDFLLVIGLGLRAAARGRRRRRAGPPGGAE